MTTIVTSSKPSHHSPVHVAHHAVHHSPAVTVLTYLASTVPGRILLALTVILIASVFMPRLRRYMVVPAWRLVTGGLVLRRPGPWDSSWDRPAPDRPEARPSFHGERYPRTSWARMPGYRRMLIRWATAAYVYLLVSYQIPVLILTVLALLALVVYRLAHLTQTWAYRQQAGPFVVGLATILGIKADPTTWIAMPRVRVCWTPIPIDDRVSRAVRRIPHVGEALEHALARLAMPRVRIPLEADDAQVLVQVDADMVDALRIKAVRDTGTARLPEGPWDAEHRERELTITFKHPKRPPADVWYDADANRQFAVDCVPIGQKAGGAWAVLPLKDLTPHGVMSATTGWCKTTTANVYVAHTAGNGGRVFINDPKRVGYTIFQGLDNVVIRTTPDGWADTQDIVLAEMERRYALIERFPVIADSPERFFQPWFVLVDERGSYVADLADRAKQNGEKGLPTVLRQEKKMLWQGRAAAIYQIDLCQQANLKVFVDSDGRDQRMWRIASGPQTHSSWFMLFAGLARKRATMRKGRAMLGIGVDSIEEITLARVTPEDAREFAAAGAGIADMQNAERERNLRALIEAEAAAPAPAPEHQEDGGDPAKITPDAPGQPEHPRADEAPATPPGFGPGNVYYPTFTPESPADQKTPDDIEPADTPDDLVIGLTNGAEFLGMTRANFESARKRRAIQGETRTTVKGIDMPAWTPLALREWRSQAPRAGAS
jgi:hypothetical protein